MPRPKKTKTADLVRITEEYFMYEAHGDASKLKCTLIAKYAKKAGYPSCEHWDFRRDEGVQNRIRQLTALVENEGLRSCPGDLFRPMDKDKLIRNAKDPEKLRTILEQMEQSWKLIYENSVQLKKEIVPLREENESLKHDKKVIAEENVSLSKSLDDMRRLYKKEKEENIYFRKYIRTHVTNAVANEVLKEEGDCFNPDISAFDESMDIAEKDTPLSFKEAVSEDSVLINEVAEMIKKMKGF